MISSRKLGSSEAMCSIKTVLRRGLRLDTPNKLAGVCRQMFFEKKSCSSRLRFVKLKEPFSESKFLRTCQPRRNSTSVFWAREAKYFSFLEPLTRLSGLVMIPVYKEWSVGERASSIPGGFHEVYR